MGTNENSELKIKNQMLKLEIKGLEKYIQRFINQYRLVIGNKSEKFSNVDKILNKMNEKCSPDQNQNVKLVDISEDFIYSLVDNIKEVLYTYTIYHIYCFYSQITYKILRSIIPLPSEQMLYRKYGTELTSEVNNLLDSSQISFLLDEFRKELRTDKAIFSTIEYDSATVDPKKSGKSNLLVFNTAV